MMKRIASEDKAIVTDNTPSRLRTTWISQECELRVGPRYITRKYSFFDNDTFLLLQYHYAEESCSIATYTVVARGSINISSPSVTIPGAVETNVQLDSVHLIPLNRQVAHKFGRRVNASCGGVETKWRPYLAQLIYERPTDFSSDTSLHVHDLNSNSLQSRSLRSRRRHTLDCLESFGIEFDELRLLRVEVKRSKLATNSSRRDTVSTLDKSHETVELLLGGLARNVRSQKIEPRPNRLQATPLLHVRTAFGCPICGSVIRATEYSPPLFHQTPSFPAVIGGLWLSIRCESIDGGFWSRRFFRIYSDNSRWFARWTSYADSACSNSLYMVTAAGTYVQRAVRKTRDTDRSNVNGDVENILQGSDESITLRANQRQKMKVDQQEIVDRMTPFSAQTDLTLPSGTTELELRILESLLIPVNKTTSTRCGTSTKGAREMKRVRENEGGLWSKNCIPPGVEASETLTFKAKIGLDWNGDYTLLLASSKNDLWEAPLRRCSSASTRNYFRAKNNFRESWHEYLAFSRRRNRYDRFNRYRRHWFSVSSATCLWTNTLSVMLLLYWLHLAY
ncbi:Protein APCDD1 [Habropoda laboriosa]|uniref:Protein APCDD1 n=2 Tax=Habropoda laboriosa TaxID=597456 RepID=A0A0L7RD11_9HYME|nr:Protein APCDD1 [Habropoda laboriosa]